MGDFRLISAAPSRLIAKCPRVLFDGAGDHVEFASRGEKAKFVGMDVG
jgi:hypothetical protein